MLSTRLFGPENDTFHCVILSGEEKLKTNFSKHRSHEHWVSLYDRANSFGAEHSLLFQSSDDVSVSGTKTGGHSVKRTVKTPLTMKDFVITSTLGQHDDANLATASEAPTEATDDVEPASQEQTWYQQLYLPVVDTLLSQLDMRFTEDMFAVARAVDAVFVGKLYTLVTL